MCHGDIKMENVMVTSWNWVMLTDFSATFKPTALPEDNPADFSYFFDTSRDAIQSTFCSSQNLSRIKFEDLRHVQFCSALVQAVAYVCKV